MAAITSYDPKNEVKEICGGPAQLNHKEETKLGLAKVREWRGLAEHCEKAWKQERVWFTSISSIQNALVFAFKISKTGVHFITDGV
jgi:hypothetical protein